MSESKHTPGPWVWNEGYCGLSSADGHPVLPYADYENMWLPSYDAQGRADGHLIAAAPDLLAACWAARAYVASHTHDSAGERLKQIEAAIAKAEGRS
jgi:hypothetical protein